jgi:hypothetical protein
MLQEGLPDTSVLRSLSASDSRDSGKTSASSLKLALDLIHYVWSRVMGAKGLTLTRQPPSAVQVQNVVRDLLVQYRISARSRQH